MKKILATIVFTCPECHANFEFDAVGEYESVACPICGSNYMTVKKGNKVVLENFDQTEMYETPILA